VLLLLAAIIMPWLAAEKRHLAAETGSGALRADAAESALCGYMAWIALAALLSMRFGRITGRIGGGFVLTPLIMHEGWEAMHGQTCRDS